jgi:F-type H+-transporting ATPase subunit b
MEMPHTHAAAACELMRKVAGRAIVALLLLVGAPAFAHEQAALAIASASAAEEATQEPAHEPAGEHEKGLIAGLIWPTANFIILCGVLYYFLKTPFTGYLAERGASIRKDLVDAAALKATATAQLAAIDQKLHALPGELDALRKRGAEEMAAEEQRIAAAAVVERERLLEQTRREIDLQVRLAKRAILEHAADLSVQLATERLTHDITAEDQAALVNQYLNQVTQPPTPKSKAQA